MRIAYFDCFGGASGDMIVGALLHAGLDLSRLRAELATLELPGYRLDCEPVTRGGLGGIKFHVLIDGEDAPSTEHKHSHGHDHGHGHDHAHSQDSAHAHDHGHGHEAGHAHAHRHGRNLPDILGLLDRAKLPARADARARRIFRRLAEAEAKVHNTTPDKVHFHEVGAVDSIVDIVGAAIALELLEIDRVECSAIPLGSGHVHCDHGRMPVPAPATAELMRNGVIAASDFAKELCTPTGAAILTTLAESFGPLPAMAVDAIGYGAGGRDDPGRSNMLRVFVGSAGEADDGADTVIELSCNLDDVTGQVVAAVIEMLLAAGAVDAWATPIVMKKGRPAIQLSALCPPAAAERAEQILLTETTTLGVRRHASRRSKLARRHVTVETPYGPIRVKLAERDGAMLRAEPEFDDCRAAAERHHVPLRELQRIAVAIFHQMRTQ